MQKVDGGRQVSWLADQCAFHPPSQARSPVDLSERSPLTVAGAAAALDLKIRTAFPFSPSGKLALDRGTVTAKLGATAPACQMAGGAIEPAIELTGL